MDRGKLPAEVCRDSLPDHRDLALFVATLFQRLGGSLEIDRDGNRRVRRPEPGRLVGRSLPQLADAGPSERFRSIAEWEGAIRLAEYWLNRLGEADRDYVFTLLAQPALDPRDRFDFRDRL
jgi:hypothetical protein